MDDRGSGRTTALMEEVVELLGLIPEGYYVFITGAHPTWLFELSQAFKEAGLTHVEFFTVSQIKNGCLRGRKGRLLIDDEYDIPMKDRMIMWQEQRLLRVR